MAGCAVPGLDDASAGALRAATAHGRLAGGVVLHDDGGAGTAADDQRRALTDVALQALHTRHVDCASQLATFFAGFLTPPDTQPLAPTLSG